MPNYISSPEAEVDAVFAALADPTRRAVVRRLGHGPSSVSELAQHFPMALPSFLRHIRVLEASGIVRTRKSGRVRSCELHAQRLQVLEHWLDEQRRLWSERGDRLAAFAEAEARTRAEAHAETIRQLAQEAP